VLGADHLNLQIVIAGAERADLILPARDCAGADGRGIGPGEAPALLGAGEIFNIRNWWAVIIILLGVYIILSGVMQRGRNPRP